MGFQARSLDGSPTTLAEESVAELGSRVRGDVLVPGDAGYDAARSSWNAMIDRKPALIVRCSGSADVQQAVRFCAEHSLLVSVRGAGHNIAGKALKRGHLRFGVRHRAELVAGIGDFDADGNAVDVGLAAPSRDAGMPGSPLEGHELHYFAIATDQQVRRHAQSANLIEVWMRIPIELVGKQFAHERPAEIPRGQTDAV